jgi:hypothetical protein
MKIDHKRLGELEMSIMALCEELSGSLYGGIGGERPE